MAPPQVVPAATVTTHAKPHGQQQLARDLEVERVVMGQRCRPQSFGEVSDAIRCVFLVKCSSAAVEPTYVVVLLLLELSYGSCCPEI